VTSLAVTATATGGGDVAAILAVTVLTGAAKAASQNGATITSAPVPPQAAITPSATGSTVFGATLIFPMGTLTPTGQTTFSVSSSGAGDCSYGAFFSTSPTAGGTPVTLGASAPAGEFNQLAMAEILASGTLAVDPSTPPALFSGFLPALTTAQFSPPGGALLVAQAVGVSNGIAVSDTLGLTWSPLAVQGQSGVWIAQAPAAPAPAASAQGDYERGGLLRKPYLW
jgi:hypothetical protein